MKDAYLCRSILVPVLVKLSSPLLIAFCILYPGCGQVKNYLQFYSMIIQCMDTPTHQNFLLFAISSCLYSIPHDPVTRWGQWKTLITQNTKCHHNSLSQSDKIQFTTFYAWHEQNCLYISCVYIKLLFKWNEIYLIHHRSNGRPYLIAIVHDKALVCVMSQQIKPDCSHLYFFALVPSML